MQGTLFEEWYQSRLAALRQEAGYEDHGIKYPVAVGALTELAYRLFRSADYRTQIADPGFDRLAKQDNPECGIKAESGTDEFIYRSLRKGAGIYRLSANVYPSSQLIRYLDKLMNDHDSILQYKVTNAAESATLVDPVTVYLSREPSPQLLRQAREAIAPHVRKGKDVNAMSGHKITDGLFLDTNPTPDMCRSLLTEAGNIDPRFGDAIRRKMQSQNGLLSAGQFQSIEKLIADCRAFRP